MTGGTPIYGTPQMGVPPNGKRFEGALHRSTMVFLQSEDEWQRMNNT